MSRVLVTGGAGFIGHHLVTALKARGDWVRAADREFPAYDTPADEFEQCDLREAGDCAYVTQDIDEVWALAADMGGMGYISSHDADILTSNLLISVHTAEASWRNGAQKLIFSSSACVYPEYRQDTPYVKPLAEDEAWPAQPQDGYGWEKLVTERLLLAYEAEGRLDVRIARLHNIYGPEGTWRGGREKAPAALCRKAAEAPDGGEIDVWGDGQATRSFCYITDCIEGLLRLADSDCRGPLNIGSSELVTVDGLARLAIAASGKDLGIRHVAGPQGVRGRNSDNTRCKAVLGWVPQVSLEDGIGRTYEWVAAQVAASVTA